MPADIQHINPDCDKAKAAAHTPGTLPPAPWHVDPDDRPDMEWNNHICSADGNTVCFMAHNPGDNTALENAARLIAAAPCLLEALKRAVAIMDNCIPGDFPQWKAEARSAINRAETGQ